MSRIIKKKDGQLEDPATVAAREKELQNKYPSYRTDPILASVIDTIDFELIRQLIVQEFRHSGQLSTDLNFIPPDKIRCPSSADPEQHTRFAAAENIIVINKEHSFSSWPPAETERFRSLHFLHLVIHEEVHAASAQTLGDWDEKNQWYDFNQTGYFTGVSRQGRVAKHIGYSLNEAVTEALALKILKQYAVSHPEISQLLSEYFDILEKHEKIYPHFGEMLGLQAIIEKISQSQGLDREEIFKAFAHDYFSGYNPEDSELVELWKQVFPFSMEADPIQWLTRFIQERHRLPEYAQARLREVFGSDQPPDNVMHTDWK